MKKINRWISLFLVAVLFFNLCQAPVATLAAENLASVDGEEAAVSGDAAAASSEEIAVESEEVTVEDTSENDFAKGSEENVPENDITEDTDSEDNTIEVPASNSAVYEASEGANEEPAETGQTGGEETQSENEETDANEEDGQSINHADNGNTDENADAEGNIGNTDSEETADAEGNAKETADTEGNAEDAEKTAETGESAEDSEVDGVKIVTDEAQVPEQVELVKRKLYASPERVSAWEPVEDKESDEEPQFTDQMLWAESLWQWMYKRDAEPEAEDEIKERKEPSELDGTILLEDDTPLVVEIDGMLPEGVEAVARYVDFAPSEDARSERALFAVDITFYYTETGAVYVPESMEMLTITLKGEAVSTILRERKPLLVYANAQEDRAKEVLDELESGYVSSVRVFTSGDNIDPDRLGYIAGMDGDRFYFLEDGEELLAWEETDEEPEKITFKTYALNTQMAPLRFVFSAQQTEHTATAESGKAEVSVTGIISEKVAVDAADADTEAAPVDSENEVVVDVDVNVHHEDVEAYVPDTSLTYKVESAAIGEAVEKGEEVKVWVAEEGADSVEVEEAVIEGNTVQFTSEAAASRITVTTVKAQSTVLASDGNQYRVTVEYDASSGLPDDAVLDVVEIPTDSEEYTQYVGASAEKIGQDAEKVGYARAFDISIVDKETGEKYQPTKDVKVSIELLDEEVKEDAELSVVHFAGSSYTDDEAKKSENTSVDKEKLGEEAEVVESTVVDGAVQFESGSFSVYVVIKHEGGEVENARVEFHFIDRYTDEQYQSGLDITQTTTSTPYNFAIASNKNGGYQTSQILKSGESLELINDPSNISIEIDGKKVEKYFYGWTVVNMESDNSQLDTNTSSDTYGKYSGTIEYNWPQNPDQIAFGKAITITHSENELSWDLNGVTGTGTMDGSGTVHVYLAPLYEDFYFINFHSFPRTVTEYGSSLMTRKLLVFGSASNTDVHIGNIVCDSPDPQHKIFSGWERKINDDWYHYKTVRHVIDAEGNLTNEEVNSEGRTDGYYINVEKGSDKVSYVDLYPRFDEARWLYFNTGKSGNGATYVGASYRLTNDDRASTDDDYNADYYYFDQTFFTGSDTTYKHMSSRPGYTFDGWYVFGKVDADGELSNYSTEQDVSIRYLDTDNTAKDTTIHTQAIQVVDGSGNIKTDVGIWYVATDGTISQTETTGSRRLFEVDSEGKLRFYKAMNDMTLYARWVVKPTTYRVIIWKQKVTDHKKATDDQKTYDYERFYTSNEVPVTDTPDLTSFNGSYVNDQNKKQSVNNRDLLGEDYTGFHYSRNDIGKVGKPKADGTTVYNVYYDRNLMTINWRYRTYEHNVSADIYTETEEIKDGLYGWVDGQYVPITYEQGDDYHKYTFSDGYTYTETTEQKEGLYGVVDNQYVPLVATEVYAYKDVEKEAYILTTTLENGKKYLIVNSSSEGTGYALDYYYYYDYYLDRDEVSINVGTSETSNQPYIFASDLSDDGTSIWTVGIRNNDWTFSNNQCYLRRTGGGYGSNPSLKISDSTSDLDRNQWTWNAATNKLKTYYYERYLRYNSGGFELSNSNNSKIYFYVAGKITQRVRTLTGYTYSYNDQPYEGKTFERTDEVTEYNGKRYTDAECTNPATGHGNGQYGKDANGVCRELNYETGHSYKWYYQEDGSKKLYTGARFEKTTGNVPSFTGLYGQTLAQNGYKWPEIYWWRDANDSSRLTFIDAFRFESYPEYCTDERTMYLYRYSSSNERSFIKFYLQNLDGTWPDNPNNTVGTDNSNASFSLGNKYNGFNLYMYSTDSGRNWIDAWNRNTNPPTPKTVYTNSSELRIRFERNKGSITFDVNYPVDGNISYSGGQSENKTVAGIYYEAPLNGYGSTTTDGITHWYYGVVNSTNTAEYELKGPDHYIFGGWYEDKSCTKQFNFNSTMPVGNKIVYAKWEPEVFLIKFNPNGGEIDHIDHNGYAAFGSGTVTIDSQTYTYDFTTVNANYQDKYPIEGRAQYNKSQSTYIHDAVYGEAIDEYSVPRRFVAMTDRVAEEYKEAGGTIYYYLNYQWKSSDGEKGIYSDVKNAMYLTEAQIEQYYELYRNIVIYSKGLYPDDNETMILFDFDDWKQLYVSDTPYRVTNSSENWVFLGWFKTGPDGKDESMPYNFSDPVTEDLTLTAHWRLNGGYTINYVPKYKMPDGPEINGEMPAWRDPADMNLSYANDAKTKIYKAPTGLTMDGEPITDDSVIFRGWALVTRQGSGTADDPYVYTPLETDTSGNINTYYLPSDDYVVSSANASTDSVIYMQAIYQYKDSSDRRPKVTNLTLDANTGYVNTRSSASLPEWKYPGVQAVNLTDHLTTTGTPTQILFGDVQSSAPVHLYKYATEITEDADEEAVDDAHQYFEHSDKHFLLGFDNSATEGDFIATYPADSVIAVQRNEERTVYAVWEPMVYVTFKNETGVTDHDLVFNLGTEGSDTEALEVINIKNGMYDREPLDSYSNIELKNGETLTLAFPKGAEKTLVISGTNGLGVGKKLVWNSSIDLVNPDGTTTSHTTVGSPRDEVVYSHEVENIIHNHTLVRGGVNNTKTFSFNETMIENQNALTVTFTKVDNAYALLLNDNYTGGGTQEIDYAVDEIQQPENGEPKTQVLPITSTRAGFTFLGWSTDPNATEPEYSASKPEGKPWTIVNLDNRAETGGFFSTNTVLFDQTYTRTLYAVWEAKTDAVYVYKDVPDPGNKEQAFTFTLSIRGKYLVDSGNVATHTINQTQDFKLKHGEYLRIDSSNHNFIDSGQTGTAYVQAVVEVYYPVTDEHGVTSDVKDESRSKTVRWEANVAGNSTNRFVGENGNGQLTISVTETAVEYYDTSVTLSAESSDNILTIGDQTFRKSELEGNPQTVNTETISWTSVDAGTGGTVVFVNQRQKYNVKVTKTLISNTNTTKPFDYTAVYEDTYTNLAGNIVSYTKQLDNFTVASGSDKTLENIPAGVKLTITEVTDENDNYETHVSVDGATETEGKVANEFEVGVNPSDSENKTHIVAFSNKLKSFNVTFKLVDQNGDTTINGVFSLASSIGSLGSELYARHDSVDPEPGVFYPRPDTTNSKLWADEYKLSQITGPSKYIKLPGEVTLSLTGKGLVSSDTENIEIEGNQTDGYIVKVINRKTVDITLKAALLDPMYGQRTFVFSGTYKLNGKTYDLTRKLLEEGASPTTTNLIAYSTNDGSVSSRHEPITFEIPVGASELEIKEDTTQFTTAPDTIASTYDISTGYTTGTSAEVITENKSSYTYNSAISDSNEGDIITIYNKKKTIDIDVKKVVDIDDRKGSFKFTVKLLVGNTAIKGYPIVENDSTDIETGEYTFELVYQTIFDALFNHDTCTITVPIGVKVTIQETGVENPPEGMTIDSYGTSVKTIVTETGESYTGTTSFNDGDYSVESERRLYTLQTAPSTPLTVTFTNDDGGVDVKFMKIDGYGNPLDGTKFRLYTDQSCNTVAEKVDEATSADGTNAYKDSDNNKLDKGVVCFQKVSNNVYYMKETSPKTITESGRTVTWQNENTYVVLVGETALTKNTDAIWTSGVLSGLRQEDVTAQRGTQTDGKFERDYAIFLIDENGKAVTDPDIASVGIMNEASIQHKVILRKVTNTYLSLDEARFRIFRADLTEVKDGQPTYKEGDTIPDGKAVGYSKEYYESGVTGAGAYFTGTLPEGKYYIVETKAPSDSYTAKVYALEIRENGSTHKELGKIDGTVLKDGESNVSANIDTFMTWIKGHLGY